VALEDVEVGATPEVQAGHTFYRLENRGDGKVLTLGHPRYCPQPSWSLSWAPRGAEMRLLGRGMKLQFVHPALGLITTSRIQEIRDIEPEQR
jgi:hypothetical protein